MPRKAIDPMKKILEIYQALTPEEKRACTIAMAIFGGDAPKPSRTPKPKASVVVKEDHPQ